MLGQLQQRNDSVEKDFIRQHVLFRERFAASAHRAFEIAAVIQVESKLETGLTENGAGVRGAI
jgi:hypothetical protein